MYLPGFDTSFWAFGGGTLILLVGLAYGSWRAGSPRWRCSVGSPPNRITFRGRLITSRASVRAVRPPISLPHCCRPVGGRARSSRSAATRRASSREGGVVRINDYELGAVTQTRTTNSTTATATARPNPPFIRWRVPLRS